MSEALLSPSKHHNFRNKEIQLTYSILLYADTVSYCMQLKGLRKKI